MRWAPCFGAWPEKGGTRFRVWAPAAGRLRLVVAEPGPEWSYPLTPEGGGFHGAWVDGIGAGVRYRYLVDERGPYPDPASRFQPLGVHGPSQVVDPYLFAWSDHDWPGVPADRVVFYELHVGTFTAEGTFEAVERQLPALVDLGVTAVELMPVAEFPGQRNWGYDGASLFAPAHVYGSPDDFRTLVNTAHRLGLAVYLDVVYNHLGPDGAYLAVFSPQVFSDRHRSLWGAAVNLDGPLSDTVRRFLIDNALHWVHEYHIDGLRLDATHGLIDESPRHFVAELTGVLHAARLVPPVTVFAEDNRNLATIVRPSEEGGWNVDGVWADDFHHEVRRLLAGDHEGYYRDYGGTTAALATSIRQGWLYTGQHSVHHDAPRGTDPAGIPLRTFVACLDNHDQIGNRPFGDRLHHRIDLAAYRAASALLLLSPLTPLLFMGQEWAASSPFLYFTDHAPALGRAVTEGRRREFRDFSTFRDPGAAARIPDPQDPGTYRASRLVWTERLLEPHASVLRLYRALLRLGRAHAELQRTRDARVSVSALDADTLGVKWGGLPGAVLMLVARLRGEGLAATRELLGRDDAGVNARQPQQWEVVLTTEDPPFSPSPRPPVLDLTGTYPIIHFAGPAAVVLTCRPDERGAARKGAGRL
jgi:maltooligosyltrehalose trehalohydrolase